MCFSGLSRQHRIGEKGLLRRYASSLVDAVKARIYISQRHFDRLVGLIEDAQQKGATVVSLAPKGESAVDTTTSEIAPHLIFGVTDEMQVMQEEIFGPLLPVKTYTNAAAPLQHINSNPRPVAAYYFGDDQTQQALFARHTTSGALVINDVMTHASIDSLPFGGVGASGKAPITACMVFVASPMPNRWYCKAKMALRT